MNNPTYEHLCAGDMAAREGLPRLKIITTRREDAFEAAIHLAITQLEQGYAVSAEATLKDALKFQYGNGDE